MAKVLSHGLRTWIEIDRKAIRHNFNVFKKLIPTKTKLMAVVKSNAYGSDFIQFSHEMGKCGADYLGVDSMVEATALRREGIQLPILVLGYTLPELFQEASEKNIALSVSSFETLQALQKARLSKPVSIHIKVDTGMHRQGFFTKDMSKILGELKSESTKLKVEGLFTHFASAKNPAFPKDTLSQIAEFELWEQAFKKAGLDPIVHASATAGTMLFPQAHFDMVRVGIGLYGLWPAKEVREYLRDSVNLKPVLVWKSLITEVKKVPSGSRIGYDLTEMMQKNATIAVVPIGYWHGYPRALSSIGRVLVNGKRCKVLGRVSMDMMSIDVTGVKGIKEGDEVVVLGIGGRGGPSAEGLADLLDASWYEVITRINPLIKRFYL
ncbi:MAG: alanine racemase [Candidatus Taylorbacteria bacterium]|nr:alanine racemase [Candidatus Taylorbacteria bacterium]